MKNLLVLFISLCLSAILYAQDNFKPGYIITNQQDTLTGWINLRTDKNNQKQCEFKPDLNHAATIYFPGDIAGYRFTDDGKYYVSKEIQLNGTPQKVFLEFLVKGIMNLYYYEDTIVYYFFENQDGKMDIISRKPEKIENMTVRKDYEYIGRIRYLFRDYQPIAQKTDNLKFDQKSMMNVVEEYHNEVCTTGESCIVFRNEHPDDTGLKCKISIYTGLQLSNYTYDNYVNYSITTHTSSNVSPTLGAQINLINPRWSKSFSLQLDASLSQFKGVIFSGYTKTTYKALASSFRWGIKYTYPTDKISPAAEAGIAYTYLKEGKVTGLLRHSFFGYYFAIGADYKIKSSHAIFIRFVYEDYSLQDSSQIFGNDKISMPNAKIGYTF